MYYGLSRLQLQTLKCRFPSRYSIEKLSKDCFDDEEAVKRLVCCEGCIFINPKKLTCEQLARLISRHEQAIKTSNAVILLFSNPLTTEQKRQLHTEKYRRANLLYPRDRVLADVVRLLGKAYIPCSEDFETMKSNMFNDGWYLVDIETSGFEPLTDEIIMLSVAYMSGYKIESVKKYYVNPRKTVPKDIIEITGISKEDLKKGISHKELVKILSNLGEAAPIILYSESYFVPFLKALFSRQGKDFNYPWLAIDELAASVFSHLTFRTLYDILESESSERYIKNETFGKYLDQLYHATLVCFDALSERYGISSMGDIKNLYNDYLL